MHTNHYMPSPAWPGKKSIPGDNAASSRRRMPLFSKTLVLLCALFLCACSHLSVGHLHKNILHPDLNQELLSKNLKFDYTARLTADKCRITGTAYPLQTYLPGWAVFVQDMTLFAYLSDSEGHILSSSTQTYLPHKLKTKQGNKFNFVLDTSMIADKKNVFVSFGYNLKLTSERYSAQNILGSDLLGDGPDTFFAREGAVLN